jgi:hypothetical protein
MKLLMESWRKYLCEDNEEKYFGPDPEQSPCMNRIREKGLYDDSLRHCMEQSGWKYFGEGHYRMVFEIPGNDEAVLKVAKGSGNPGKLAESMLQNKTESNIALTTKYNYVVPKIYDTAKDYLWVKQQKVVTRPHLVRRKFDEEHPELSSGFGIGADYISDPLAVLVKYVSSGENREDIEQKEGRFQKYIKACLKSRFLVTAADMYAEFNMSSSDVRPGNFGYVTDYDGTTRFVIHDFGWLK